MTGHKSKSDAFSGSYTTSINPKEAAPRTPKDIVVRIVEIHKSRKTDRIYYI